MYFQTTGRLEHLSECLDKCFTDEIENTKVMTRCSSRAPLPKKFWIKENKDLYEIILRLIDIQEDAPKHIYCIKESWSKSFGIHEDVPFNPKIHEEWCFEGMICKIIVRVRDWHNTTIVQGLQIFDEKGESKAFGMTKSKKIKEGYFEIDIPKGQHIRNIHLRSGYYIDAFGLKTNEGQVFGFYGGTGGGMHLNIDKQFEGRQYFIDGIRGKVVQTNGGPAICDVELKYLIVP